MCYLREANYPSAAEQDFMEPSTVNRCDDGGAHGDAPLYYHEARLFHVTPAKTVYSPFSETL